MSPGAGKIPVPCRMEHRMVWHHHRPRGVVLHILHALGWTHGSLYSIPLERLRAFQIIIDRRTVETNRQTRLVQRPKFIRCRHGSVYVDPIPARPRHVESPFVRAAVLERERFRVKRVFSRLGREKAGFVVQIFSLHGDGTGQSVRAPHQETSPPMAAPAHLAGVQSYRKRDIRARCDPPLARRDLKPIHDEILSHGEIRDGLSDRLCLEGEGIARQLAAAHCYVGTAHAVENESGRTLRIGGIKVSLVDPGVKDVVCGYS